MLKLRRIDLDRSQEILESLDKYQSRLIQEIKPKRIILFGSFARGDFSEASDIDLIIIADWKEDFLDRIKVLLDLNEFGLPLEPVGYTQEEFDRMLNQGNRFIQEVAATGKIIYEQSVDALPCVP